MTYQPLSPGEFNKAGWAPNAAGAVGHKILSWTSFVSPGSGGSDIVRASGAARGQVFGRWVMGFNVANTTSTMVCCSNPAQPHLIEKTLAWLEARKNFPCPYCGAAIDLQNGDNHLRIRELLKTCANLDSV